MDTLADAPPREIARVSAKRDRWRDMVRERPSLAPGMNFTIAVMQAEIDAAIKACANGDIAVMLTTYQSLKDYSDDVWSHPPPRRLHRPGASHPDAFQKPPLPKGEIAPARGEPMERAI